MKMWQRGFSVEGLNLERFVQRAAGAGIGLIHVLRTGPGRLRARAWEKDFAALAALAEQGGWRFVPLERRGLGRAQDALLQRRTLAVLLVMALLAATLSSRVMWRVEVTGAGTYAEDVAAFVASQGVAAPMWRRSVDVAALRDALEWRYPRVAWFECGWRGVTFCVRAVEGNLPLREEVAGPCDVVAARDGIVSAMVTVAGTPAVAVGDLVRKGQVLIRGEERTSEGAVRPVAARGTVTARVWEGASVRMLLNGIGTEYTGSTQTAYTVRSPWFDLWRMPESGFAHQDVHVSEMPLGGLFLPLTVHVETRMEAEMREKPWDLEALKAEGAEAALRKLYEKVNGKESLVDNWVNWSIIEDEILLSVAIGERLMDIGQRSQQSGMAAPE